MLTVIITCVITTSVGAIVGALIQKLLNRTNKAILNEKTERKAIVALLRHEIVNVYVAHKDKKEIPFFLKESTLIIYEVYKALGGNSFIEQIIAEIKQWKVID